MGPLCDYRRDKLQKQHDTHMVEPRYNAIYKLSNFVVAIVIRGVWNYDRKAYVARLRGRLQSCSFRFSPQQ